MGAVNEVNLLENESMEDESMDLSKLPELLKDKRGIIDGRLFFEKSPFLNFDFLVSVVMSILCILIALTIAILHWATLSAGIVWMLVTLCGLLPISWLSALRNIRRIRSFYMEELIGTVEAGSPMDIALGVAANSITEGLSSLSCAIFMALSYAWLAWILLGRAGGPGAGV